MQNIPKIVSGGQTEADRAALDWALSHKLPCGGWFPKGRKAEDGLIDAKYPLKESPSASYLQRTEWNVRDSDATVLFLIASELTADRRKPSSSPKTSKALDSSGGWRSGRRSEAQRLAGAKRG
jgi:hypothetical protein